MQNATIVISKKSNRVWVIELSNVKAKHLENDGKLG